MSKKNSNYLDSNFLNTNYSYILHNNYNCGSLSDISYICPSLGSKDYYNPSNKNYLEKFSYNLNLFNTYGKLWCMNSENQHLCKPDENDMLIPKQNYNTNIPVSRNEFIDLQDINNLNFSNNIINDITNSRQKLDVGKKIYSTGTHINSQNNYVAIDTSNNPYPYNIHFSPDNVSDTSLSTIYKNKLSHCYNKNIYNKFRPIYLHIPDQFLEICEPIGYESYNVM